MVDTIINNNDIVPGFDDENDDKLNIRLNKLKGLNNLLVLYLIINVALVTFNVTP